MIGLVYTSDLNTIDLDGIATIVYTTTVQPAIIVMADVSGITDAIVNSLTIELGTWSGGVFTPTQRIGFVAANAGETNTAWIYQLIGTTQALRLTTAGNAETVAHIRVQGLLTQVSPA